MQDREPASGIEFVNSLRVIGGDFSDLPQPAADLDLRGAWNLVSSTLRLDDWELARHIASSKGIQVAQGLDEADPGLLTALPFSFANSMWMLPLRREGNQLTLAVANPFDANIEQLLHFVYGNHIRLDLAPPAAIEVAIAKSYADLNRLRNDNARRLNEGAVEEKEIPRLCRELMERAVAQGASDMHIQPFVGGFAVRYRIDGLLRRVLILPDAVGQSVVRYFKARANMDPTNQLVPQDGSISMELGHSDFDLRISTLPVAGSNEKLVVRFLTSAKRYSLDTTGLSLLEIQTLRRLAANPSGVVLLCGPTGSGKTTTLYAILAELNKESVSITTVEDPVEYRMPGLSQTQVNKDAGMTFASALRSILRQDPDVILIGEIRDAETAQIGMQSAMTGHLVFSTLHTNDAVGAIPRLLDLGLQPAILSQALVGVVSQRLIRRLCPHCRQAIKGDLTPSEQAFKQVTSVVPPARAKGCAKCGFTGYQGRVAITQMIEVSTELSQAIADGEKDIKKLRELIRGNADSLADSAARRIISAESTAEEAARVLGRKFWLELADKYGRDLPELAELEVSHDASTKSKVAILVAGESAELSPDLQQKLEASWLDVEFVSSPEDAHDHLKANNHIELVVLDVPDFDSEKESLRYVSDYRTAMAWSRLPAILLIGNRHKNLRDSLIREGATSLILPRTTAAGEIATLVNNAIAKHMDYRWTAKG